MLGEGGVGKSCLTVQLCHSYFCLEYDPTIGKNIKMNLFSFSHLENLYRKPLTVDNDTVLVEILDTAGLYLQYLQ